MKCIDLINSFPRKATFAKQVLINVRDRTRVNVEAGLSRIDICQPGAGSALNANADPGLQNSVASDHDVFVWIENRCIQRMGQRSDHPLRRTPRQLRVRVKSQNKANIWKKRKVANFNRETIVLIP